MSKSNPNSYYGSYFAVYKHRMITKTKETFTSSYIVIKNRFGMVEQFTELELFSQPYTGKMPKRCDYTQELYLNYVCPALNYITNTYDVVNVDEISPEMVFAFLDYYTTTPQDNGEKRSSQSVYRCINNVSRFFANLYLCTERFDPDELMQPQYYKKNIKSERVQLRYEPLYHTKTEDNVNKTIFRDIPIKAMDVILKESRIWNPEIYFLIICQITTGLRPSEALNLRQNGSAAGNSLKFTMVNGDVTGISVDLTKEYQMRSDGKRVGGIKKPRIQNIYPGYIPMFMSGYKWHMNYLSTNKCDQTFLPLFPNKQGNAMTYPSYRQTFTQLLKTRVLPNLQLSDDPDVRVFALRLENETLCPHALRHFYTVSLVLKGLDIGQIQMYRGDKDPTSALTYVNGKGEIIKKIIEANTEVSNGLMEIGGQILGH